MNSKITDKIINQTAQQLSNGTTVPLTFHYPANFKIGDTIEVTAPKEVIQLFVPQDNKGYYQFDVEIWDDSFRLYCDFAKELKIYDQESTIFFFKIREIELFANHFSVLQKAVSYN